jgi:hypothetical protein
MNDSGKTEAEDESQGTGARGEHERRRQERRDRVLARHPRIGWLLLALAGAQAYEERPRGGANVRLPRDGAGARQPHDEVGAQTDERDRRTDDAS